MFLKFVGRYGSGREGEPMILAALLLLANVPEPTPARIETIDVGKLTFRRRLLLPARAG